jgi:hypothetical protein
MFELQQTGYDSNQFWKSFGFPLYVFAYSIALLIILPPTNFVRSMIVRLTSSFSKRARRGFANEGGEESDSKKNEKETYMEDKVET